MYTEIIIIIMKFMFVYFQLPYTISIEYIHNGALLPPELNIPATGLVPTTVETFTVHLTCSGNVSEEVPIAINLHVHAQPAHNDTKLNFKRNKICMKGESIENKFFPVFEFSVH